MKDYKNTFTGVGKMGNDYNLTLRDGATPVVHAPRRVPFALRDKLKSTLDELV